MLRTCVDKELSTIAWKNLSILIKNMIYEEGVIKKASEKPTSFSKQQKGQFCIGL